MKKILKLTENDLIKYLCIKVYYEKNYKINRE